MQVLICIIVACLGVTLCQGATTQHTTHLPHTHAPHATREPSESDSYSFNYDPITHHMVVRTGHMCYIVTMTADELIAVHSDVGLKALELRILSQLSGATEITKDMVDPKDLHHCGGHTQHYYTV